DLTKRPNMDEVVRRLSDIKASLSEWKLRSRFVLDGENPVLGIFKSTRHWARQLGLNFVARRLPARPTP
ncbi:hypothetical protein B0H10DRAFT_1826126, partial [Mycena sp. CBHHK59/15]